MLDAAHANVDIVEKRKSDAAKNRLGAAMPDLSSKAASGT